MTDPVFYQGENTPALSYAKEALARWGLAFSDTADSRVTHVLLGAPTNISALPEGLGQVTVIGGRLRDYGVLRQVDLLSDPEYLAENADITAHCAVKAALQRLPVTVKGLPVLVVGWGRIGKCLGRLLRAMGAAVTIAARKPADRAMAATLGYDVLDTARLGYGLVRFRLIFNTADAMVLPRQALEYCRADCLKIDLASTAGMEGADVLWLRGLPGKEAPETSGELIARTVLRHLRQEGDLL